MPFDLTRHKAIARGRWVHDHLEFFRQFRRRFKTTGAVSPSSRFLAKALVRPLRESRGPARVLEIGPGTGAVTRKIVELLGPEGHLDLVELNEAFATNLAPSSKTNPVFTASPS